MGAETVWGKLSYDIRKCTGVSGRGGEAHGEGEGRG